MSKPVYKRAGNPTQRQIARLYTLAGKAGLDHAEVIAQLRGAYNIETTKALSLPQYEEFCAWIRGRLGARRMGDGIAPGTSAPTLWQRGQVAKVLEQEWSPAASAGNVAGEAPALHDKLVDVLDDFRLYRNTGRISAGVVRAVIGQIRRYDIGLIAAACDIWLSHYRERNEAYFLGILRRLKRESRESARGRASHIQEQRAAQEADIAARERAARTQKTCHELEAKGWMRVGRLPTGEPVYEYRSATYTLLELVRGGMSMPLRPDQRKAVIYGADQ